MLNTECAEARDAESDPSPDVSIVVVADAGLCDCLMVDWDSQFARLVEYRTSNQ